MKKSESGFGGLGVFVVVILFAVIGIVSWYVLTQDKTDKELVSSNPNGTSELIEKDIFSVDTESLPESWHRETGVPEGGYVLLRNSSNNCTAQFMHSTFTGESNSPDLDHAADAVRAIKDKGYNVEESSGSMLVMTKSGQKQLDAQILDISGMDNPMFQKIAYVSNNDYFMTVTLSCGNEFDITSAEVVAPLVKIDLNL